MYIYNIMFKNFINNLLIRKVFTFEGDRILMLNKVPFVIFPARSMAKFIQIVGDEFGDDYLYKLGYDAGLMVGKDFVNDLGWFSIGVAEKVKMIFKMFEVMGFGNMDIRVLDSTNDKLLYKNTMHPVINHAIKLYGKKEKSCIFYRGIESAHWNYELGVEGCELIETQCMKDGAKFCEWSHNVLKKAKNKKRLTGYFEIKK